MDFPPSGWVGNPITRLSGCWFSLLLSRERLAGSARGLGWLSAGLGGGEGDAWAVTGLLSEIGNFWSVSNPLSQFYFSSDAFDYIWQDSAKQGGSLKKGKCLVKFSLTLSVALVCGLTEALAELIEQPQLHADEGLPAFLGQLAPGFGSRQHVTDAALREP